MVRLFYEQKYSTDHFTLFYRYRIIGIDVIFHCGRKFSGIHRVVPDNTFLHARIFFRNLSVISRRISPDREKECAIGGIYLYIGIAYLHCAQTCDDVYMTFKENTERMYDVTLLKVNRTLMRYYSLF